MEYLNMSPIEKAIFVATLSHQGQVDKGGQAYILHPLRVMMNVDSVDEKIVAVLHDVLEDTEMTADELNSYGFSEEIIDALVCLTKVKSESYQNFIVRVSENKLATSVKIADLRDNMNLSRIKNPSDEDFKRIAKYNMAMAFLCKVDSERDSK